MRIDAHQHFWQYDPVRDSWIDDTMQVIRRDFMPQDLQPLLEQHQLDGCVAVQADQSEAENTFLLDHAASFPFIKGVVGWVDLCAADIEEKLAYYTDHDKMKGFRHILQGEPQEFMLQSAFLNGISRLNKYNYTYDVLVYEYQLPAAYQLVAQFPDQPFVIDHIGKPKIGRSDMHAWKKQIHVIASCENVSCKISGMVTEADHDLTYETYQPYMETVTEAFGTDRIMYGSDWPVCLLAASYNQALAITEQYFSRFSKDEQALFYGGNAIRFYGL